MAALRAGNPAAFDVLFARHSDTLHRLARRHLATAAQAEDVVQQTWLAVLEGIDRFEGRSSFRTWLCTILVYTALRHAVREGRALPFSDAFPDPWHGPGGSARSAAEALDEMVGHRHLTMIGSSGIETEPVDVVLAGEVMTVLCQAIDALPRRQRAVLVLVDVEGRSQEEASQRLGLSHGNVRLLLHRARLQVRRSWRSHLDAERHPTPPPSITKP